MGSEKRAHRTAMGSLEAARGPFDLGAWRSLVTERLLVALSALGTVAIVVSIVQATHQPQSWPQTTPFVVVYGLLLALTLLRDRIDYRIGAWGILLLGYTAAVMYMTILGLLGNGVAFLVVLPALGLIILGSHSGMIMALLSVLIYLVFTAAAATGIMADWLIIRENTLELTQWLSQGLSAIMVLVALVVLLTRFLQVQVAALAEARTTAENLAVVSDDLQARTTALDRYTHLLEVVVQISRQVSSVRDSGELLHRAVDLLAGRLDLERVAVYWVVEEARPERGIPPDEGLKARTVWAVPGYIADRRRVLDDDPEGEEIPEQVIRLVARATSGPTTASGVGPACVPGDPPEISLPLRAGGRLLAVLHAIGLPGWATTGDSWRDEEITALELMADQLAVTVDNARLLDEAETRLLELNALQRHYTAEAWEGFVEERGRAAYQWLAGAARDTDAEVKPAAAGAPPGGPAEDVWHALFEQVRAEDRPVSSLHEDSNQQLLAIPVRLRDALIGVLGFHRPRESGRWQPEETSAIEAVASRMAFAAENLRLLEETQQRAARERLLVDITSCVRETLDVDTVLQTAIREIGQALKLAEVEVRMSTTTSSVVSRPQTGVRGAEEAL